MRWTYKIIRTILVSLLSLAVGIPVLIYTSLWLSPVRNQLRVEAQRQLSALMDADVNIRELDIEPFSRLILRDAAVTVQPADTVLQLRELSAGFSLQDLLLRRRIVITDVVLMDPRVALRRDSVSAPLNVEPIIRALKGDGSKPPMNFDLAVQTVVIRGGEAFYDVLDRETITAGTDPNHLKITGINADVNAPRVSRDSVSVRLRRLQFREESGIVLSRLSGDVVYTPERLTINGLTLRLPASTLRFADMNLALKSDEVGPVSLLSGSQISLNDLAPVLPFDSKLIPNPVKLSGRAELFRDSLHLSAVNLAIGEQLAFNGFGNKREQTLNQLSIISSGESIGRIAGAFVRMSPKAESILASAGDVTLTGSAHRLANEVIELDAQLSTNLGALDVVAALNSGRLTGSAIADELNINAFLPGRDLGSASFDADFDLARGSGSADVTIGSIGWRGHDYRNLIAKADYKGKDFSGSLEVNDSLVAGELNLSGGLTGSGEKMGELELRLSHFCPDRMGFKRFPKGYSYSGNLFAQVFGEDYAHPCGFLNVSDLAFANDSAATKFDEQPIELEFDFASEENFVKLSSGPLDLKADGKIDLMTLARDGRRLAARTFPQLFLQAEADTAASVNDFAFSATIHEQSPLFDIVSLPVRPLYDVDLQGRYIGAQDSAMLSLHMPYLQVGKKLVREAEINLSGGSKGALTARAATDNKYGRQMNFYLQSDINGGVAEAILGWNIDSDKRFDGAINFSAKPLPGGADVNIHRSEMVFNDAPWTINPAYIGARSRSIVVGGLTVDGPGQQAVIRGVASPDSADVLAVRLENIDLDYLFETLNLGPQVTFGGTAIGTVTARALLSPAPILQTSNLHVKDFSYNHCVFGNADIRAGWDASSRGILLSARVSGPENSGADVDGVIYPISQNLDIRFDARNLPTQFMQPFLASWCDDVGGRASGHARLFGSFVMIDLEGDLYADDFSMKIGYTGVTYHATDSVHIRPGRIELNNIAVSDSRGNSAILNGRLTHDHFIETDFNFHVTEARGLQVLDLPSRDDEMWYGSVFGNGSASITGHTGKVDISADMRTSPGSEFTFALTDSEQAAVYDFLTFRDAAGPSKADSLEMAVKSRLKVNKRFEEILRRKKLLAEAPTSFGIKIRMDVTPEAKINLVMDPVAGDKITAYGAGHMDFIYESANDEMRLYGDYLINRGDYNFTLQDIIIKNFSLRDGSLVSFHGDPLGASLNVSAAYQLNANLSDLDDSFLHDKEIQRTNVPVQAVLNLGGDLQSPDISFDLDFPTLTSDVKRKVRSIVSTEEMMNRQIIYLLALNRFYTPDYMAGATKGNELASLASGTISSQLSNILGQLSNKFSVAPSLRSDAGDFSDLEVDVALSSTLLNNRLLLNGNFGYRDKSLNNNQFIGDFDVEYLLNRSGKWRLKAYNHFNDRNLYVKTALTTQGLGLVFKHDWGK